METIRICIDNTTVTGIKVKLIPIKDKYYNLVYYHGSLYLERCGETCKIMDEREYTYATIAEFRISNKCNG